jgi:ferredoxin
MAKEGALTVGKKVKHKFPKHTWDKPVVYTLHSKFNLIFNILKAQITPNEEGLMILELVGEEEKVREGIEFLREIGVGVRFLAADIEKDEEECVHCGACASVCPSGALYIDRETYKVIFDKEKCVGCELCVGACIYKAIKIGL